MPDLNELYERWRNAPEGERTDLEGALFARLQAYAQALVYKLLGEERNDDFVQYISTEAMTRRDFGGKSLFTTWVYAIAKKKVAMEIRSRRRQRKMISVGGAEVVEYLEPPEEPRQEHSVTLEQLAEDLSPEDLELFRGLCAEKDQNELARDLGITPHAAETRRRRLRDALREKFPGG